MKQLMELFVIILFFCFSASVGATNDTGKPWEPEPKVNNTHWTNKHSLFLETTKNNSAENPIEIVFLGDSHTDLFGNKAFGKSVWDANYASMKAVNYGIGGDRTEHVLWRILNGEIDGLKPKVVVLLIGVNNVFKKDTNEDILKGIVKILETLQEKLPETKIILLGWLPGGNNDVGFKIVADMNLRLARLESGKKIRFLDMWHKFARYWPSLVPELYYKDNLHLSKAGYQMWADTMNPLLKEVLAS